MLLENDKNNMSYFIKICDQIWKLILGFLVKSMHVSDFDDLRGIIED